MATRTYESRGVVDTTRFGERLAGSLQAGDMVLLSGPLGAGKSVIARAIAGALGASAWRGSPTYNLVHEYPTVPPLYHADLYRLSPGDLDDLGLEEYVSPGSILVVEWPERAGGHLMGMAAGATIQVSVEVCDGDSRLIHCYEQGASDR